VVQLRRRTMISPVAFFSGVPAFPNEKTYPESEEIPSGAEFEERAALEAGFDPYDRRPLMGPFGTMEAPVLVPSNKDHRVVGCLGHPGVNEHPLLWLAVYRGRKHVCARCGQVFLITGEHIPDEHHDDPYGEHGGEDHGHGDGGHGHEHGAKNHH